MQNKLILITGGSSGIGKAAAKALLKKGGRIIIQARNIEKLKSAANEIDPTGERVRFYSTDLTDQQSVETSAKTIVENEGLPDIIVNSAGAGEWLSFNESTPGHYKETMDSPYIATALTCKVFYDLMQERGSGRFIIINSAACYFSFSGATGYTPARWAMLGFAKSLQADLYGTDFKVSMITFGKVDSPYFTNNPVSEERIPRIVNWLVPTLSEEQSGNIIAKHINANNRIIVRPFIMKVFVILNRLVPGFFSWLMRVTN